MTLRATWTIETVQDLNSMLYPHCTDEGKIIREIVNNIGEEMIGPVLLRRLRHLELNIEQEITSALSAEITAEIDKQIIADIIAINKRIVEQQNER